jgi:Holliday junction resolvasome RuvABC DNA-binding subunit
MDPKQVVLQCVKHLVGQNPKRRVPASLKALKLSPQQLVELKAKSCDALVALGYTKSQAFREVQKVLDGRE